MKTKDKNINDLKAFKKARREEEIELFGGQISFKSFTFKNKKRYTRKLKHKPYDI